LTITNHNVIMHVLLKTTEATFQFNWSLFLFEESLSKSLKNEKLDGFRQKLTKNLLKDVKGKERFNVNGSKQGFTVLVKPFLHQLGVPSASS